MVIATDDQRALLSLQYGATTMGDRNQFWPHQNNDDVNAIRDRYSLSLLGSSRVSHCELEPEFSCRFLSPFFASVGSAADAAIQKF